MDDPNFNRLRNMPQGLEKDNWRPQIIHEDQKFMYYYDLDDKLRRVEREYQQREGIYRLKFLEKPYRWWRYRSRDARTSMIPVFISIISGVLMYKCAIYISEWEALIKEKAKIPEEFNSENLEQFRLRQQQIEQLKKNQQQPLSQEQQEQ